MTATGDEPALPDRLRRLYQLHIAAVVPASVFRNRGVESS